MIDFDENRPLMITESGFIVVSANYDFRPSVLTAGSLDDDYTHIEPTDDVYYLINGQYCHYSISRGVALDDSKHGKITISSLKECPPEHKASITAQLEELLNEYSDKKEQNK